MLLTGRLLNFNDIGVEETRKSRKLINRLFDEVSQLVLMRSTILVNSRVFRLRFSRFGLFIDYDDLT